MAEIFEADLAGMQAWAKGLMASRPPDFVIGDNYLRRWWVLPRNPWCNVYLHEIRKSDDDRALHDHPWFNVSTVIEGGYREVVPDGRGLFAAWRGAGAVIEREPTQLHRLEIVPELATSAISLFVTGPKVREWGFACPQGWVHWRDFVNPDDPGQPGRGCGEHSPEMDYVIEVDGRVRMEDGTILEADDPQAKVLRERAVVYSPNPVFLRRDHLPEFYRWHALR